jgi:hypothetical protein
LRLRGDEMRLPGGLIVLIPGRLVLSEDAFQAEDFTRLIAAVDRLRG